MKRSEFIKTFGLLGLGLPILETGHGMFKRYNNENKGINKIIVIGAGAAGLTAAYLLKKAGIEVQVLEAGAEIGGRMKIRNGFSDFPIALGAEWLHSEKSIFSDIVDDKDVKINIETKGYNFENNFTLINNKRKNLKKIGFTIDQKFIGSSWLDFFKSFVIPIISKDIALNQKVKAIDYSSDKVYISTKENCFTADKVIITVPLEILKRGTIEFAPMLPQEKKDAIKEVKVWGGIKAFIEFSEKFYPTVNIGAKLNIKKMGHKLFYDASFGQNTQHNILGLLAVGPTAKEYQNKNGDELILSILKELDGLFEGMASKNYIKHTFHDWDKEDNIGGAYVHYFEDWKKIRALGESVGDNLYFAGDAYTDGENWSSVDAAAKSAIDVVNHILIS